MVDRSPIAPAHVPDEPHTATHSTASLESGGVPEGMMGLDCGPKTIELNNAAIAACKTIIW